MRPNRFLFFCLFLSLPVFGLGTDKCKLLSLALSDFFEKRHIEIKASNLTEKEKQEMQGWFKNTKLGSEEEKAASKKVFELLRKKLLHLYPDLIQKEIDSFPEDFSYVEQDPLNPEDFGGNYTSYGYNGVTRIKIPERYRGTFIEFMIRTHEEYHQIERKLLQFEPEFHGIKKAEGNPSEEKELRFLREVGAIMREWQYLNSIPHNVRNRWIEYVKKDSRLSTKAREYMIRVLQNASLGQEKYLELEHKAGRYSYESFNIEQKQSFPLDKVILALAAGGGTLGALHILKECNTLQKTTKELSLSDILFYKKFCQRVGFSSLEE